MPAEYEVFWTFLAAWARVAAVFSFVPIPGLKAPVSMARIALGVTLTIALYPVWRSVRVDASSASTIVLTLLGEAGIGMAAGLLVSFLFEAFQFAAQLLSQQAGFSYAATIDPTNNTDTGVILVLSQLLTGFLSLIAGLDLHLLEIIANSFQSLPLGASSMTYVSLGFIQQAGATVFQVGLSLTLPSIAVFLAIDIVLGLLSRIEQQLQLTTILFPMKTVGSIVVVMIVFASFPNVFNRLLQQSLDSIRRVLGV